MYLGAALMSLMIAVFVMGHLYTSLLMFIVLFNVYFEILSKYKIHFTSLFLFGYS